MRRRVSEAQRKARNYLIYTASLTALWLVIAIANGTSSSLFGLQILVAAAFFVATCIAFHKWKRSTTPK